MLALVVVRGVFPHGCVCVCVWHVWVDARVFLNGAPVGGVGSYSACNRVTVGMRKSEVWGWVRKIRVARGRCLITMLCL